MEKVIKIGSQSVRLKSNGLALLTYKRNFGSELIADLFSIYKKGANGQVTENDVDLSELNPEAIYNIAYGAQAEAAGIIMSQDAVDGANTLNDVLDMLKATINGIITATGAELAANFARLLEGLTPLILAVASLIGLISNIPAPVLYAIAIVSMLVVTFIKTMSAVSSVTSVINTMNPAMWKTVAVIMAIVSALIILVALIAAIAGKKDDIKDIGSSIADIKNQSGMNEVSSSASNIPRYASGTNYHPGGLAFITEFAPEQLSLPNGTNMVVMPRGTKVNPNISSGGTGGDVFNISINAKDVREFNDIVNMAKKARMGRRSM